uniref:Uncharacterized protein n=1 Tax=Anguilla anguilla TaxID=7936 RepID=A0A0E9RRY4_ANGAN
MNIIYFSLYHSGWSIYNRFHGSEPCRNYAAYITMTVNITCGDRFNK